MKSRRCVFCHMSVFKVDEEFAVLISVVQLDIKQDVDGMVRVEIVFSQLLGILSMSNPDHWTPSSFLNVLCLALSIWSEL